MLLFKYTFESMMRLFLSLFLIISFSLSGISQEFQTDNTWRTLSMVTYKTEFNEDWGMDIEVPQVNPVAMALNGKEIEVEGFIIPLTGKIAQSHLMLSAFPKSMCFFCGAAGPESAMEVFMKDQKEVAFTPEKVKFRGILHINPRDMNKLLYSMENAVMIKE